MARAKSPVDKSLVDRSPVRHRGRRGIAGFLAFLLTLGLVGLGGPTTPAAAEPAPVQPPTDGVVSADALPTAQINGVAWAQVVVGDTVYVGGNFSSARPAGASAGQGETKRTHLLAYTLSTGVLTSFAPSVNGQVKTLAASPDGRTVYAGGAFTSINGVSRSRIAAFDTASGTVKTSFGAGVGYTVNALAATADTVYAGGAFTSSGSATRTRLAAFAAANGALTTWAPSADRTVHSLALSPDGSKLIVGGMLQALNGVSARGIGAVDARTGATIVPWRTNATFYSGGSSASVLSLSSDGTSIYGGVYKYGAVGALEGTFKIDPADGAVQWLSDCHGDVYGVWAGPAAVYQVGHSHYCGNHMGWPQPSSWNFNRGVAYTREATGTLTRDPFGGGYASYPGAPAPSLYSWFPRLDVGTFTGKSQAAWSVAGNADYVVVGGEFPLVNNTAQQGLVRFAVRRIAPDDQGPRLSGSAYVPSLTSTSARVVKVSATANWDRDDRSLTHRIQRSNSATGPWTTISTRTLDSAEWERPPFGVVDGNLAPGSYSYRILVSDPDGNAVTGGTATITVASSGAPTPYGQTVIDQGASLYWPLNETTGRAKDLALAGFSEGVPNTGVTRGTAGAIAGDAAMTFSGSAGGDLAGSGTFPAPATFTAQAWFRTTSTGGGRILGFSDLPTGTSAHRDRQIWLSPNGQANFGVYGSAPTTVTSSRTYNDGVWHQAVASLGPSGMALYIDGVRVGQRSDVAAAEKYVGTWRIGGDSLAGWASGNYFNGAIDEVSIYPTVLTVQQINAQYAAAGRTSTLPPAPTDPYGAAVFADQPTAYWRLTELTGTTAADSGPFRYPATYQSGTTRGQAGALVGSTNPATLFNGSTGSLASDASFANPRVYSVEAWFRTTTTRGGTLIGFGNSRTGLSTTSDRQVYLRDDGKVAFRTGTGTGATVVVSPAAYNDGSWHHAVATQGADGMVLYLDGAAVGSNPSTGAAAYTGYWRVAADTTGGSTSAHLAATIDEPAVYPAVLDAARVAQHYQLARGTVANQPPTARIAATPSGLTVDVDGSGSSDPDGSVVSHHWAFGDGASATGATVSHPYAAAGTYTVTLTVTDNAGATAVETAEVTVSGPPPTNQPPTAVIAATSSGLTVDVDGSGSSDPDGSVVGHAWTFGDGGTGTGVTASHPYAAGGTYTVTLTVTDDEGATASTTAPVTVTAPPGANQAPTAAFTATTAGLTADVNGAGSSDPDGSVVGHAWTFGDGGTGTGVTASHPYPAGGTYTVTLTVTDDEGATASTSAPVTVSAPPASQVFAADTFDRTVGSGWGSAATGGAWTITGATPAASVSPGVARLPTNAGQTRTAMLTAVNESEVDLATTVRLDKAPAGGSSMVSTIARRSGSGEYRMTAVFSTNAGRVNLQLNRIVGGASTQLGAITVPGLVYSAGSDLNLRMRVVTAGTGTQLQAKGWLAGSSEPTAWTLTRTDSAAALPAGAVGLLAYVSGSATNPPVTVGVTSFTGQRATP